MQMRPSYLPKSPVHPAVMAALCLFLLIATTGSTGIPAPSTYDAPQATPHPVRAARGMVVSADTMASNVGRRVLMAGGNAVDAAVATGLALAVTYPGAGNIGGGGFMVIRFPDGRVTAFDFREKAPLAAHPQMFLDENGEYSSARHHNSHLAVGVPGTVAGFFKAQGTYGRLNWADLVEPAVDKLSQCPARNRPMNVERLGEGRVPAGCTGGQGLVGETEPARLLLPTTPTD